MSQETKFQLEVVTPARRLFLDDVDEITVPGIDGEFGVLVGHTPYLTEIGIGEMLYRIGGDNHYLAVRRGFAEITHEKVAILAEEADFPQEINLEEAQQSMSEAEEALTQLSVESKEYLEAQAKLDRAMNRIAVAKRHSG